MSRAADDNRKRVSEKINEITEQSDDDYYVYRGEPEHYDKVSSALYRRYENDIEAGHIDLEIVQARIIQEARNYTDETDADEILTQIQHYGGETNLIDFTTDIHIAIFFACNGSPEKDGRVILQRPRKLRHRIARQPRNRVISQKSILAEPLGGFLEPDKIVSIPKELKQPIMDHLRRFHGIFSETVYNDLHGYIANQRNHGDAYTEFYEGLACWHRGDYDDAIQHFTESIRLNPIHTVPYNDRGAAYDRKGELSQAIRDYTKAIELDPNNATAYFNRGGAFLKQKKWDKAESDLHTAVEKGFAVVDTFRDEHTSVTDFETLHGVTLPGEIKTMLAPQQDEVS